MRELFRKPLVILGHPYDEWNSTFKENIFRYLQMGSDLYSREEILIGLNNEHSFKRISQPAIASFDMLDADRKIEIWSHEAEMWLNIHCPLSKKKLHCAVFAQSLMARYGKMLKGFQRSIYPLQIMDGPDIEAKECKLMWNQFYQA